MRSRTNKQLAGVCGGLAEYLETDATVIRVAWVMLMLFGGMGLFAYIVLCFVLPAGPPAR
jgi:phage shock protein PspC (stress-responsive transcriptional regulator)